MPTRDGRGSGLKPLMERKVGAESPPLGNWFLLYWEGKRSILGEFQYEKGEKFVKVMVWCFITVKSYAII